MRLFSFLFAIGLLGSVLSIYAAIHYSFHYWYSFFVISSFLLFDSLDFFISKRSIIDRIRLHGLDDFLKIYFLFALIGGVLADSIYGRLIANAWTYPYLGTYTGFLIPVFIFYPFGGLSLFALYRMIRGLLHKFLGYQDKYSFILPKRLLPIKTAIYSLPFINFIFNNNSNPILFATITLILSSIVTFIVLLRKNKLAFVAILLTAIIGIIFHEVPNFYAGEWIYKASSLSDIYIFRIPFLILIDGWVFMVFGVIEMIELEKRIELKIM